MAFVVAPLSLRSGFGPRPVPRLEALPVSEAAVDRWGGTPLARAWRTSLCDFVKRQEELSPIQHKNLALLNVLWVERRTHREARGVTTPARGRKKRTGNPWYFVVCEDPKARRTRCASPRYSTSCSLCKVHSCWIGEGRSRATVGAFFHELGERSKQLEAVSMDMCAPYILETKVRAPQAEIAFDPFHVVKLASEAVHDVRRTEARERKGSAEAAVLKGSRWALLEAPENLRDEERVHHLSAVAGLNARVYRTYLLFSLCFRQRSPGTRSRGRRSSSPSGRARWRTA